MLRNHAADDADGSAHVSLAPRSACPPGRISSFLEPLTITVTGPSPRTKDRAPDGKYAHSPITAFQAPAEQANDRLGTHEPCTLRLVGHVYFVMRALGLLTWHDALVS